MKQPVTIVALIYAAGVVLGHLLPLPLPWLFGGAFVFAALAMALRPYREVGLWLLLASAGWTNLAWRTAILSPSDLRSLIAGRAELATVQGTLTETPVQRVLVRDAQESWHTLAVVEVRAVGLGTNWLPAVGTVMVRTPGLLSSNYVAGRKVELTGVLRPPAGPLAEGLFDYRTYLAWQGIYCLLQTEGESDWRLLPLEAGPGGVPLSDRFQTWAKRTLARGLPQEDEELRLLWAMSLGWKTGLTGEVSEPFMRSGTMHIFAISGLHIALIAGILVQVLRLVQVPRGACGLVVIPLIWFYTAATGWQSSAIRSTIMMTVVIAGWALARPGNLLNSLAVSGFVILLWEPRQLFQAGFQLSFFVVLSIALLVPPFEKLCQRWLEPDPLLPDKLRSRWQRWRNTGLQWLATSLATSLAAWLGSLPLIAHYFHLVTPVSLAANLVIVPLSSLALMCNLGSLLCGGWLPLLTEWFNHSAWLWMHMMVGLSEWFVIWPGAYCYVPSPPVWVFLTYYLALVTGLAGWWRAPPRRVWAAAVLGLLLLLGLTRWCRERGVVRLAVLPLSGGHAVFVDRSGRAQDLLVDCGNESAVEFVVKPFLHAQGVNRLAHLALTHGDLRHVGGARTVVRAFTVAQVVASPARYRSEAYRRITAEVERTPGLLRKIARGDALAGWQVLHPGTEDVFAQADDLSLVFAGTIHDTSILLLGDLGPSGQRLLMDRYQDLQADIIIGGLPRQGEPFSDAFLERVRPRLIILGTAQYPAAERGSSGLRERLAQPGIPVVYTSDTGAVTLGLSPAGWQVGTAEGVVLHSSGKAAAPVFP